MLIHRPVGRPKVMWRTLETLYKEGLFRTIGVSNFYTSTLPEILDGAEVLPVVDQCEASALYQQRAMLKYLEPYPIALEAWRPLVEGRHGISRHPLLSAIGARYGKTAAQVALKFFVQSGIAVIPKTHLCGTDEREHRPLRLYAGRRGHEAGRHTRYRSQRHGLAR